MADTKKRVEKKTGRRQRQKRADTKKLGREEAGGRRKRLE
jgi:hypothetical protein